MKPITVNFPSTIFLDYYSRINLSGIEDDSYINIDGLDYIVSFIIKEDGKPLRGGGNSLILKLNSPHPDELGDEELPAEAIMKICKYPLSTKNEQDLQRIERFKYEIKSLIDLKDKSQNVIQLLSHGKIKIGKQVNTRQGQKISKDEYLFYVLDYAEYTLPSFLKNNDKLSMVDKIDLCYEILNGLNELQQKGYYHRDIKADNILFVNGEWKISDLGLSANQNDDKSLDLENEKIGPYGWLSPEVMNKVLTENKPHVAPPFDCVIDLHSDFFQVGKLFWYIFQGNLPIGNLRNDDFRANDGDLFEIILWLLQYDKKRRPKNVEEVNAKLLPIQEKYLKMA